MRNIVWCDIRTTILWISTVLCAAAPAHADFQAAPVSVIEVITAEVPASLLTDENHPDHSAATQPPAPSAEAPETRGNTELGSAIFNPLLQADRQPSGVSGQAANFSPGLGIAWNFIALVAVLVGVVAVVLLARAQESDSDS